VTAEQHRPVEHHPPLEEYLQTIESLTEEGAAVIQARIAERLGKSPPSVSEMLDRLADEGYVERRGRRITLTERGHALAQSVIRKHRLAERLLVDVIGLPWHLVHEEAGRWEHVMSDAVEARLVQLLGDPGTCPHGNPVPGSGRPIDPVASLADARPGDLVQLRRVSEQVELDYEALVYLDEHGFTPGATALVSQRGPDGTLLLELDDSTVAFGPDLCARLYVVAA